MESVEHTILVVDDQDGVRQLLYEVLQSEGYTVRLASNGCQALKIIEEFNPQVILIDMKMPGMSGLDVLKELDRIKYQGIYVMMTAYGELEIVNEASQLGVKHFINKPFDIDELREIIEKAFSAEGKGKTQNLV